MRHTSLALLLLLALLSASHARELTQNGKCKAPKLTCGPACVNSNLPDNCGGCGIVCRPGESCAGSPKRCKCGPIDVHCRIDQVCADDKCVCAAGLEQCGLKCLDLQTDEKNCGACGAVCDGVCDGGQCKCTSSAQCPDETPICNSAGHCVPCSMFNDQGQPDRGLPCALRALALKTTAFQCDYPQVGGGSGRCVECNIAERADDNDCAFLIDHSAVPEAADLPNIDPALTYCGADHTCIEPP